MVLVVVKGSQDFVDVLNHLVGHTLHHEVVIGQSEFVVQLDDVSV